jgi:hypothetical protein
MDFQTLLAERYPVSRGQARCKLIPLRLIFTLSSPVLKIIGGCYEMSVL